MFLFNFSNHYIVHNVVLFITPPPTHPQISIIILSTFPKKIIFHQSHDPHSKYVSSQAMMRIYTCAIFDTYCTCPLTFAGHHLLTAVVVRLASIQSSITQSIKSLGQKCSGSMMS